MLKLLSSKSDRKISKVGAKPGHSDADHRFDDGIVQLAPWSIDRSVALR